MSEVLVVKRPYSVGTKIPQEWKELLEAHVVGPEKEYTTFSEYIRDLIRGDMKKRGLFHVEKAEKN